MMWRSFALLSLPALCAACSLLSEAPCRADDECDAAARCVEGACTVGDGPTDAGGAPADAGGAPDAASPPADAGKAPEGDAGPDSDGGPAGDDGGASTVDAGPPVDDAGPSPFCTPVHDGVLTSAESPVVIGIGVRYLAAGSEDSPVSVDLAGSAASDGVTEWHFEEALPGDSQLVLEAQAPEGFWFSDRFEGATYVAALDRAGETLGVFRRTEEAVLLLGAASAEEGYTLLTYDPPVPVLAFPLAEGDTLNVETEVSGTFEGNPYYVATDSYETVVDAAGRVVTNAGAFPVLRVRVHQTVRIPILVYPFELVYETWRYTFLTPCLGQVAYVASRLDETEPSFTEAAEVRRVGIW